MTRKQALYKALETITNKDVIEKINEILDDMPFTGWSKRTIFDTIDQFIIDNGRSPTTTDFKKKGLPPHPVIKLRFGISLKEFLEKYYSNNKKCNSKVYFSKTKEYWKENFIIQYHRVKPTSAEGYNRKRSESTPSWGTVAKLYNIDKWLDWLRFCNIIPYINKKEPERYKAKTASLNITSEYNEIRKEG